MDRVAIAVQRRRFRILLVDDNVDLARTMALVLKMSGHEVQVAHDGTQGISIALGQRPDVVLLDIGLPDMDGCQVAQKLRHEAGCRDALIIAITAYGHEDDRRRSREAGIDHHLVKPVEFDTLQTLLSQSEQSSS